MARHCSNSLLSQARTQDVYMQLKVHIAVPCGRKDRWRPTSDHARCGLCRRRRNLRGWKEIARGGLSVLAFANWIGSQLEHSRMYFGTEKLTWYIEWIIWLGREALCTTPSHVLNHQKGSISDENHVKSLFLLILINIKPIV